MTRKILIACMTVCLLAGTMDAWAQTFVTFTVELHDDANRAEDVWVEVHLYNSLDEVCGGGVLEDLGDGVYESDLNTPAESYYWTVMEDTEDVTLENPVPDPETGEAYVGEIDWFGNFIICEVDDNRAR